MLVLNFQVGFYWFFSEHGRRTKLKWPDTFLIESSGRRETPESIAEAKARAERRQNAAEKKHQIPVTTDENSLTTTESDIGVVGEHQSPDNDSGMEQDFSEDEEFAEENSNFPLRISIKLWQIQLNDVPNNVSKKSVLKLLIAQVQLCIFRLGNKFREWRANNCLAIFF